MTFGNSFSLSPESIIRKLNEGLEVHEKAHYGKSFDIMKFLESREIKHMRISLKNFGFTRKALCFDLETA